jgi:DNA-binding MarR family transcriptional regulator
MGEAGLGYTADGLLHFEVGMRIQRLARTLRTDAAAELADLGFSVYGDYEVISTLRRAPAPVQPSEIADRLMLTRAGVAGRLAERGLIERKHTESDGRAIHVSLSPAGRRAAPAPTGRVWRGSSCVPRCS